ncbi:hypothetical protein NUW54_g6590 [Trametes sanguinea]|uniref:Uncharacterized protein n=1 Tax=Trametes sanguinea TaxID=158606 RepID=A0ACC1PRU3_9APHY|nr:hypothetical protein NUW54_g6590 [Trametes sanguinea]
MTATSPVDLSLRLDFLRGGGVGQEDLHLRAFAEPAGFCACTHQLADIFRSTISGRGPPLATADRPQLSDITARTASNASRPDVPFMPPRATTLSRSTSQRYLPDSLSHHPGAPEQSKKRHLRSASEVDYSTNATVAGHLETIFDNMLVARGISPHPHTFLDHMLREVFGPGCARQTQNLELVCAVRTRLAQCPIGYDPTVSSARPRSSLPYAPSCNHLSRASLFVSATGLGLPSDSSGVLSPASLVSCPSSLA